MNSLANLKIIFAGTPQFAACHLQALIDHHCVIQAVLTQPDRSAGRGKRLQSTPVKQMALKHNLPVYQPETLRDDAIQSTLRALKPNACRCLWFDFT